jgi:6-phospho-beta-glucosidase
MIHRQDRLGLTELALMDIDGENLDLIGRIIDGLVAKQKTNFKIIRTTDSRKALENADFVITTFRVGGMQHRIIDEKVALENQVLGQETTGPGGFAMAMRTIPVLMNYIEQMHELCPNAWLLNFANPSGLLAEVILRKAGWNRAVGICDGPASMQNIAAELLQVKPDELYLDYFGLNHLGWIRSVLLDGKDILPEFLNAIDQFGDKLELPFSSQMMQTMKMIPNEYLYFYYSTQQAVRKIIEAEKTRGEQIFELNQKLFANLKSIRNDDFPMMKKYYIEYQKARWESYMSIETGKIKEVELKEEDFDKAAEEGYSGVALDIIETIYRKSHKVFILNVINQGAVEGIADDASVEIPVLVGPGYIKPMNVGKIPEHCVGLMNQVKAYERLTIDAALEGSYSKALQALTIHPLVHDETIAKKILDRYVIEHADYFPKLQ